VQISDKERAALNGEKVLDADDIPDLDESTITFNNGFCLLEVGIPLPPRI
jgi:hypothetical protein